MHSSCKEKKKRQLILPARREKYKEEKEEKNTEREREREREDRVMSIGIMYIKSSTTYVCVCVHTPDWMGASSSRPAIFLIRSSDRFLLSSSRFDDRTEATGPRWSSGLKRSTTNGPIPKGLAVTRRLATTPARSEGPLCYPLGTPPGSACRRGFCPFDRRSCPPSSAACSRPPPAAADPETPRGPPIKQPSRFISFQTLARNQVATCSRASFWKQLFPSISLYTGCFIWR